jgi:type I restriction enzyme, R subunit
MPSVTMPTDTSERGLEDLIVADLTRPRRSATATDGSRGAVAERGALPYTTQPWGGWVAGDPHDYDRIRAVDLPKLLGFLATTQPTLVERFGLAAPGPTRDRFLDRLQGEITRRGVVDVLRKGVDHLSAHVDLFYGAPSAGNVRAAERYAQNVFSATRQLRYSREDTALALDLCLFVNGLPVATFELKNRLTKQTVHDAVEQYRRDRDQRELLFQFGRCLVHLAVDDQEVRMCTHVRGKDSWFLPFNKGWNDGAGNPPNPNGLKTDYLWREVLTPEGLTDIIEHYAQIVEKKDERTGKVKREQIFPRYHQLDVVHRVLAHVAAHGAGRRYLIQHSAGSGKSNSIAWLVHQMAGLERQGADGSRRPLFDSVIVVTDRRILDKQLRDTIRHYAQVSSILGHANHSGDLRRLLAAGKKIIVTTVQKFPFIVDDIGTEHGDRTFALVIDEAHSGQGGRATASMHRALGARTDGAGQDGIGDAADAADNAAPAEEEEESAEDRINRIVESRRMLPNASYFAFTATPKNKTLELFGVPVPEGPVVKHRPFHSYTMKQAIQEGFILDVLANYVPVASWYRLALTVEDDPEYDMKKAQRKLRAYVEGHRHAVRHKAELMIDHFHEEVLARGKVGGEARAMIVTAGIARTIEYFHAVSAYLTERRSPYRAIVAFSGEHEDGGRMVTEATLNGFPSNDIAERFRADPYRFLVVADKFLTGYDEPLLHTMYVDKTLAGVKAVQTLSRLNRAHPRKYDTCVLDFVNAPSMIQEAFAPYYRTTILAEETDPNKLHDLVAVLERAQVYGSDDVDAVVERYLGGEGRERLDPILDECAARYQEALDEDGQVAFKGAAKSFLRTYAFLAAVLPFGHVGWEKLSIFLTFLVPKLPAPVEPDLTRGILEAIDMDSYRAELQTARAIALPDENAEIGPIPTGGGAPKPEPELERLSAIVRQFNEQFGNISWTDSDRIRRVIAEEIPAKVAADVAYQNARLHSDRQNARLEHDRALGRVMTALLADHTELFKQFSDNAQFRRWLAETVFRVTYDAMGGGDHAAL